MNLHSQRRGSLLLIASILIVVCALMGVTAVYVTDARANASSAGIEGRRLRALALSGLHAATAELLTQRDGLMAGDVEPEMPESFTIFDDPLTGEIGTVELIAFSEGGTRRIESENAKISLKRPDLLEKLPAKVRTSEIVTDANWDSQSALDSVLEGSSSSTSQRIGERVYIGQPLEESAKEQLKASLSQAEVDVVAQAAEKVKGDDGKALSILVQSLRDGGVAPARWGQILGLLTNSEDLYLAGRVDISRAPAEVLACLPGLDEATANKMVGIRASLDAKSKASLAWPVTKGAMTADQFQACVDSITIRSLQWRVILRAKIARKTQNTFEAESEPVSVPRVASLTYEAVIDLAPETPRLVFLSDISIRSLGLGGFDGARSAPTLTADSMQSSQSVRDSQPSQQDTAASAAAQSPDAGLTGAGRSPGAGQRPARDANRTSPLRATRPTRPSRSSPSSRPAAEENDSVARSGQNTGESGGARPVSSKPRKDGRNGRWSAE